MKLIDRLSRKVKENNSEGNKSMNLPYTALSPIDDANIDGDYKNALDWALKNRTKSDIKNIALTGPYGSGKSSILKTYIKSYTATDLHFLPISLATFKEEEDAPNQQTKEDLLRQIELSILQQIFYLEEDNRIPDSRFRKIKSYTKRDLRVSTFLLSIFFFSLFNISYSNLFETLLKIKFSSWLTYALHYFSLLTVIVGIMYIIYKSIYLHSHLFQFLRFGY